MGNVERGHATVKAEPRFGAVAEYYRPSGNGGKGAIAFFPG